MKSTETSAVKYNGRQPDSRQAAIIKFVTTHTCPIASHRVLKYENL